MTLPPLDTLDQGTNVDESKRPKRTEDDITRSIEAWAEKIKSNRESLLTVQLSQRGEISIAYTYLERELGCAGTVFVSRADIINTVLQKMIDENIVVLGHPTIANEWRRKLLLWYEGLSESEKKDIPIVAQVISSKASLYKMEGVKNLKWARAKFPLVAQTYDEIIADLIKLGVIDSEYKSVAERKIEHEHKRKESPPKISNRKTLDQLREIPVTHYDDLVDDDPDRPFKKLLHIFAAASMRSKTASSRSNYYEGHRFAIEHLKEMGYSGFEDTREYFHPNYLSEFRKHLANKINNGLSKESANSIFSAVRSTYKRAVRIKGLGLTAFIDVESFDRGRNTDQYRPYPSAVRTQIKQACDSERLKFNKLASDYVHFDGGCDPVNDNGLLKRGFVSLENARWIFENKLNCRVIGPGSANLEDKYEKNFIQILKYIDLGLIEVYESWGVIYQITSRHMAPYITRLSQITGLNADSLKSLNIDDYVECHELSRRPYLRYWKERSDGEKRLHLDLIEADLTWLTINQSKEVKELFAEVVYLTRDIRSRAEATVKNKLFIYESRKMVERGEIKSLENSNVINLVMNQFARDHKLKNEDGEDLNISASRLRPSMVAELVEQGVSLREIQIILGHKQLSTTIQYLDKLEFSKTARDVLESALAKIHKEAVAKDAPLRKASDAVSPSSTDSPIVISNGLVKCRNVYDPPEEITKLPTYKKGSACSLLNKCLSCRNAIITASNLPELFAMQREYHSMIATSTVGQTPYGAIIKENLEVLDSILTPSEQGFTTEQLDDADRLSEHIITSPLVEGVTL